MQETQRRPSHRLNVGDAAPDFEVPTQSGSTVSLAQFRGKRSVVLYFYPKDETKGCTAEACSFRDNYEVFKRAGAEVIGVSSDSAESHRRFAEHHGLPFILASDERGELRKAYGVANSMVVIPGRVTFVIDKAGTIRHIFSSALPDGHLTEALKTVESISAP